MAAENEILSSESLIERGRDTAKLYNVSAHWQANLCKYFVSIHGQHKIHGIRDASSSSCYRLPQFLSTIFTFAITNYSSNNRH